MKNNNTLIQYEYTKYLRQAKRRKEGTIRKAEYALKCWSMFSKNKDIKKGINPDMICTFKEKLREGSIKGISNICLGTINDILVQLKAFFNWISLKPGYKSKVKSSDLEYFNSSYEELYYRFNKNIQEYPTLEQILIICRSIEIINIIDERDRAFIAFLFISGVRIDALASLKIGSYIINKRMIDQSPKKGVRTKFSKHITTTIFHFNEELITYFENWYNKLKTDGFGINDPLFPQAKKANEGVTFINSTNISKNAMTSQGFRYILKNRCRNAGLPYFPPHSFRHGCIAYAMENAKDALDIKAISQNVGHEGISLILTTYGKLHERELSNCIKNIGGKNEIK